MATIACFAATQCYNVTDMPQAVGIVGDAGNSLRFPKCFIASRITTFSLNCVPMGLLSFHRVN